MYNYLTNYVKLLNDYVESIPAVNPVFRNAVPIVMGDEIFLGG